MTNYSIIGMAVEYIIQWQEATYNTSMSWNQVCAGATNWYENTDIVDLRELAACVLHYGTNYVPVSYDDVLTITADYFRDTERW